jgi:hypothetical protein
MIMKRTDEPKAAKTESGDDTAGFGTVPSKARGVEITDGYEDEDGYGYEDEVSSASGHKITRKEPEKSLTQPSADKGFELKDPDPFDLLADDEGVELAYPHNPDDDEVAPLGKREHKEKKETEKKHPSAHDSALGGAPRSESKYRSTAAARAAAASSTASASTAAPAKLEKKSPAICDGSNVLDDDEVMKLLNKFRYSSHGIDRIESDDKVNADKLKLQELLTERMRNSSVTKLEPKILDIPVSAKLSYENKNCIKGDVSGKPQKCLQFGEKGQGLMILEDSNGVMAINPADIKRIMDRGESWVIEIPNNPKNEFIIFKNGTLHLIDNDKNSKISQDLNKVIKEIKDGPSATVARIDEKGEGSRAAKISEASAPVVPAAAAAGVPRSSPAGGRGDASSSTSAASALSSSSPKPSIGTATEALLASRAAESSTSKTPHR